MIDLKFNKFSTDFVDALCPEVSTATRSSLYNLVDDIVVDLNGDISHPDFAVAFAQSVLRSQFHSADSYVIARPTDYDLDKLAGVLRRVGVVVPDDFITQVRTVIIPVGLDEDVNDADRIFTDEGATYDDEDDSTDDSVDDEDDSTPREYNDEN